LPKKVASEKSSNNLGLLLSCPQIVRPNWKEFPRTNPLAYQASSSVTTEKGFITLTPGRSPFGLGPGFNEKSNAVQDTKLTDSQ
jgi:hypothetical protein